MQGRLKLFAAQKTLVLSYWVLCYFILPCLLHIQLLSEGSGMSRNILNATA